MNQDLIKLFKKMGMDVKKVDIEDVVEHPVHDFEYLVGSVVVGNAVLSFKLPRPVKAGPAGQRRTP